MRYCPICLEEYQSKSMMQNETRHLHELQPGALFRFEGTDRGVWLLESLTRVRGWISRPQAEDRPTKSFKTSEGEEVSFLAGKKTTRQSCAGGAQVVPVT